MSAMDSFDLLLAANLSVDERRALARRARSGLESAFAFPAPANCRSHEQWIKDGDARWARLKAKLRQLQPTAHTSNMIVA